MNKTNGFIRLLRPINCTLMGFAVLVGAVLAAPHLSSLVWLNILFGFLTGFTFCAAAMVINDYYDRKIDAINEPQRPIPSGAVKPNEALVFVVVLSAIGFIFAGLVSALCFVVAGASLVITATYLTVGKRRDYQETF
jgi:geranylgeranylglycerol-phosphate geranylgeranyltransferase